MSDVGFNLKYVHNNPNAPKIANLHMQQLVRQLDKTHDDWVRCMEKDPTVDRKKLKENCGKNFSKTLEEKKLDPWNGKEE